MRHGLSDVACFPERPVEVEGRADQAEVCECLGEVAQRLAAGAGLFGVEAQVVGIAEHLLEEQPGVFEPSPDRCGRRA